MEKQSNNMTPFAEAKRYISEFKAMTGEYFHEIGSMRHDDFEAYAQTRLKEILDDYSIDASITNVAVVGNRARGIEETEDPVKIMMGVQGAFDKKDLEELFNRESPVNNNIHIEAEIVAATDDIAFSAFLQMEQVDLARKQVQYAIDHHLSEDLVLGAQIGTFLTENGAVHNLGDADAHLLAKNIREGNTDHLKEYFSSMSKEMDTALASQAKEYLDKLAEYKPLAKVEELVEQNYNHIDNIINNAKPAEEPDKEQEKKVIPPNERPSLKERLEAKRKIVAAGQQAREVSKIRQFPDVREP